MPAVGQALPVAAQGSKGDRTVIPRSSVRGGLTGTMGGRGKGCGKARERVRRVTAGVHGDENSVARARPSSPAGAFASSARPASATRRSRRQRHRDGAGSGMRHVRHPWRGQAELRSRREDLALLCAEMPRQVCRGSCALPHWRAQEASASSTCRHAIHLPDAPRNRSRRAGGLPEMRHGAGADGHHRRRRRPESGTGRFQAPVPARSAWRRRCRS